MVPFGAILEPNNLIRVVLYSFKVKYIYKVQFLGILPQIVLKLSFK